jgi:hypothetical protein
VKRLASLGALTLLGMLSLVAFVGLLLLVRDQLLLRGYELPELVLVILLLGGGGAIYGAFAKIILRRAKAPGVLGSGERLP